MLSWRWHPPNATADGCASDTPRSAITCSPSSIIPKWPPTTTAASANYGLPPPIVKSRAASAPIGGPICLPRSAPSSAPPSAAASTPIGPFATPYKANPLPPRVEQLQSSAAIHRRQHHDRPALG